jgi:hypothetical protein
MSSTAHEASFHRLEKKSFRIKSPITESIMKKFQYGQYLHNWIFPDRFNKYCIEIAAVRDLNIAA